MKKYRSVVSIILFIAALSLIGCASRSIDNELQASQFEYRLSTGLFSLPRQAKSVDWAIINNDSEVEAFRVTVFRATNGGKEVVTPGAISRSIEPGHHFHNANSVGYEQPFSVGQDYEVVVETNSLNMLPTVEIWSNHGNAVIPGTRIGPDQFMPVSR